MGKAFMKLVVQRVSQASVKVQDKICGSIQKGLLVLLGIHKEDTQDSIPWFVEKLINLRIFNDDAGKMNLSIKDVGGQILIISQFTLYGNCQNGRRPDFFEAAPPNQAIILYEAFIEEAKKSSIPIQAGSFGAEMQIFLVNEGPVTLIIEKKS